ncbi:hypothetical protein [Actinokineospora sp. UTMC 2448]|uniref:hypothetical protein n=1 Tax=Actinokineospora sp. UTMC 2448 TaxID=2268449 RepID=UPI002163FFC3|nr:hypothetical protein [Actinokineospora sp. UTMC 2448]
MTGIIAAMASLGMLFPSTPLGIPSGGRAITLADYDRHGHPVTEAACQYWRRWKHLLADHAVDQAPGIPGHKLATNDGWHVTRTECAQALRAYTAAGRHPEVFGRALVPFLRVAARHDGFRVH